MRSTIFTALFIVFGTFCANAQTRATTEDGKIVILNSDYTWEFSKEIEQKMGIPDFEAESFYWKDGYDDLVVVDFLNGLAGDKTMDKSIFQTIVIKSLVTAQATLKNSLSFVPKEFFIMSTDEGGYLVKVTFYGKNAYGAEGKETSISSFGSDGTQIY